MYYHDMESCYAIILGRAVSGYSLLRLNCWQLLSSLTAEDSSVKTYPLLEKDKAERVLVAETIPLVSSYTGD